MITLRITSKDQTREASFNQKEIFLGPQGSSLCEIGIPESTLNDPHCKIIFNNERYTIINSSDDLEVTVDNLAFGRRSLSKGSKIFIHGTVIEVLSTDETDQELDLLLKEVETLSTSVEEEVIEVEQKPLHTKEAPAAPTFQLHAKKRWIVAASLLCLLIIGFFSLQGYMHAQKNRVEMETALKLSDHAMNELSKKLTGEALHNRKFISNIYSLRSDDSNLAAYPTSKIYKWFGNLEPIQVDLNTLTLSKGEGRESITLDDLGAYFVDKNFTLAPNAKALSPKSAAPLYNAPRYSAMLSYFEDYNDPDFITYATLPNLIVYTTFDRAQAKEFGSEITAHTKRPLLVAYKSGEDYLISKVKYVAPKPPAAPTLNDKLSQIRRERTDSLSSTTIEIQELISKNSEKPTPGVKKSLLALLKTYEKKDAASQEKMKDQVYTLYKRYVIEDKKVSENQFRNSLISEGFEGFLDNSQ